MSEFVYIPRAATEAVASGEVIANSYWAVHPEKGLAFWRHPGYPLRIDYLTPQCNSDERVSKMVVPKILPECEIVLIPAVYLTGASRWLNNRASEMRDNP